MKITQAIDSEITRDNCETCPKLYWHKGKPYCGITEDKINSGDEYCELEEL